MDKLKIVIFEDDSDFAEMLQTILVMSGHDVEAFPDPSLCPIYRDHEFCCPKDSPCADVLISDHRMPKITGLDFFKLQRERGCKALDQNKVVISGSVLDEEMRRDIEDLGCHFIRKPFKMNELLVWVDECVPRLQTSSY